MGSDNHTKKLILAVVDYVENEDVSMPPELAEGFMAERWGARVVFGTDDIPASKLYRMATCLNIHSAWRSYQAGSSDFVRWATLNPGYFSIVADVRALKLQNA